MPGILWIGLSMLAAAITTAAVAFRGGGTVTPPSPPQTAPDVPQIASSEVPSKAPTPAVQPIAVQPIVNRLHEVYGIAKNVAEKVVEVALDLGMSPADLAAVIHFESGRTWKPDVTNPASGAVGLIQFLPPSARRVGTTVQSLRRMSAVEQLDGPIRAYFTMVRDGRWWDDAWASRAHPYFAYPLASRQSVAMSVFFPLYRRPDDLAARFPNRVLDQNPGIATPADYLAKVQASLPKGAP